MEGKTRNGLQAVYFVKALVIAGLIIVLALCGGALLMMKTEISEKEIGIFLVATDVIAVLLGGLYIGKKVRHKKYLWGLLFGIIFFTVYFILAVFAGKGEINSSGMVRSLIMMAISGTIGGMLG